MTLILAGFLLLLCTITNVSPIFFGSISSRLDALCKLTVTTLRDYPLNLPEIENVSFELRTPCNTTKYPVSNTIMLRSSPDFDVKRKTVVIVNGWIAHTDDDFSENLVKAFHCRGDVNVIVVNTYDYLRTTYINSAYNSGIVAQFVAVGLQNLNITGKKIHLIGHSLGAHLMGSAARHFTLVTDKKIARITGLDPALPCFKNPQVLERLSAKDATFVDIIHTNPDQLGILEPLGHADFYPSALFHTQTGCGMYEIVCSHLKSVDFFTESVYKGNENNFMGSKCASWAELYYGRCGGTEAPMGYAAVKKSKGIYDLSVNRIAPFGKNATSDEDKTLNTCGVCTQ